MQDVKHLTNDKGGLLKSVFFKHKRRKPDNRRRLVEPARAKKRLRIILPLLALLLAAWPLYNYLSSENNLFSGPKKAAAKTVAKPASLPPLDSFQSFQISADSISSASIIDNKMVANLNDGSRINYTLDPELQHKVAGYLAERKVPYAVFLALDPKSGKILGMVSHSSIDPEWKKNAFSQIYPMASLFKIITASAALEQKKVLPETMIPFSGRLASVNPRYWEPRGRRSPEMSLTDAMGKSVNPVFGRLASHVVGKEQLILEANRFGFNQPLFPGTSIMTSTAISPQNDAELKLMGAGLGREVKISPLHAAAMIAAVANRGVMMTPLLAEQVHSGTGEVLFSALPLELRRLMSEETSVKLARTLSTTVKKGTSRRAFHDRRGRALIANLNIVAKTGSINGKNPDGQYTWFAAYAPMEDPQIALVALVINQGKWNIKASNVGEKAMEAFFR